MPHASSGETVRVSSACLVPLVRIVLDWTLYLDVSPRRQHPKRCYAINTVCCRTRHRKSGKRTEFLVRRFIREEHTRGDTIGWRFEAGWFRYMSGLEWAWFGRDIDDNKA